MPRAFRKRLERSRARIAEHMTAHCGLVGEAACACHRRVPAALVLGRIDRDRSDFAEHGVAFADVKQTIARVESARRALEVYRSSAPRRSDVDFARRVVGAIEGSM